MPYDKNDLKMNIDNAVFYLLAAYTEDKFPMWIAYLLESIETDIGEKALRETKEILDQRLDLGRW